MATLKMFGANGKVSPTKNKPYGSTPFGISFFGRIQ